MKNLLVLNDHSPQAEHAALFALDLAKKMHMGVVLTSLSAQKGAVYYPNQQLTSHETLEKHRSDLMGSLLLLEKRYTDFNPVVQEVELTDFTGEELLRLTTDHNVYMVIKGMDEFLPAALLNVNLAINMLLSEIKCPLLIVPSSWEFNEFRDLVYLTDLRFRGLKTVSFIADLAREWNANVTIAHTTVSGLPEIEAEEANAIFRDEIDHHVNYHNISINMLKKKDISETVQSMVKDFNADLLVFVNQHFHFNTFTKQYFKDNCTLYKPIPMLIFPY